MSASAALAKNDTAQTFVASLVTNSCLLVIQVGAFVILKQKLGRIYSPRTFLPPQEYVHPVLPINPEVYWLTAPTV